MTIETTYTLDQLKEKMAEFLEISDDTQEHYDPYTDKSLNKEALNNFTKWLTPLPKELGWIGRSSNGSTVFSEYPSALDISLFKMRKIMFKPEDTK